MHYIVPFMSKEGVTHKNMHTRVLLISGYVNPKNIHVLLTEPVAIKPRQLNFNNNAEWFNSNAKIGMSKQPANINVLPRDDSSSTLGS